MRSVLREILPLALVVTISPINIVPAILLLFTRRPLLSASLFFAGFVGGVAVVLALFVAFAGALDVASGSGRASWTGWVKIALGCYLLAAAARRFRGRPRSPSDASMPRWMDGIASYSPGRSAATGVALGSLNPKNVVVGLAAAVIISSAALTAGEQVAAGAVYVAVAVVGVAAPIAVMMAMGERAADVLGRWRSWLTRNSAAVMSALFAIFGVVLIGQGIASS